MGLFKFMKDAGARLFGGGDAKAATPDALQKEVQGHGFDTGKLNIDVQGDKVKLSGEAMSQEEAERIILSVGNTVGIAEVDTSDLQVQKPAPESRCTRSRRATRSGRLRRCTTAKDRVRSTRRS